MDGEPDNAEVNEIHLNVRQLRAFQYGVGARLMPVHDGWRLDFFTVEDFEREPGTTYRTLDESMEVVRRLLPTVNTEEARAKARTMDEMLSARLFSAEQFDEEP